MKRKLIIPLVAAMAAATQVQAQSPDLEKPFLVQAGGATLDVNEVGHAAPLFTDWDGDGLKDLLVGQYGRYDHVGAVRVYKNLGSAKSPKFDGYTYVKANGKASMVPVS